MASCKLPLYWLVLAYGISQFGTAMSGIAIPWYVLTDTHSSALTGTVGFAELAPYVILQAVAGPVIDRFGLRRSCVTGNAVAAMLMAAIPAFYALGALSIALLVVLVAVAGAVRGVSDAATSPLIPRAAAYGSIANERAAGLSAVAQRTGLLVGLPTAGLLIAAVGASAAILIDGVTFAVAVLLVLLLVPTAATLDADEEEPAPALTLRVYWSQLREGFRFLRTERILASIALMVAIANLLDQSLNSVFIPVWVHSRLHHAAALGFVSGAPAVGLVAGSFLGTWIGQRMSRRATYAVGYLLGGSPVFIAMAVWNVLPPVLVVGGLSGVASGMLNPVIGAVAYERVPARLQARVLGAFRSSGWIGVPLGSLLGGIVTEEAGLTIALLTAGTAMFIMTLAPFIFPVWRGLNRQSADYASEL